MAGKPITSEGFNPSYDELINELLSTVSKLIMENSIMKLTMKKMEDAMRVSYEESDQGKKEF